MGVGGGVSEEGFRVHISSPSFGSNLLSFVLLSSSAFALSERIESVRYRENGVRRMAKRGATYGKKGYYLDLIHQRRLLVRPRGALEHSLGGWGGGVGG